MKTFSIILIILSSSSIVLFALFKIMHWPNSSYIPIFGIVIFITGVVILVRTLQSDKKKSL